MAHKKQGIYAIYDTVAEDIAGPLIVAAAEAAVMRIYSDATASKNGLISSHIRDFDLIRLGYLGLDLRIENNYAVIMTGEKWAAMLDAKNQQQESA